MRSWSLPLLLLSSIFVGLLIPPNAQAGTNADAKIAGHLKAHTTKGDVCGTGVPRPACNDGTPSLVVQGQTGQAYDLYLLILDGSQEVGLAGASFGIAFTRPPGMGLDIMGWTLCADMEFKSDSPNISWPDSGSGNLVTWSSIDNCQRTPAFGDLDNGVTAVIGALYVYAYSEDLFRITPRLYTSSEDLQVADCSGTLVDITADHAGSIGFGHSAVGYDPCFLGDDSPPGVISDLQEEGAAAPLLDGALLQGVLAWTAPAEDEGGEGRVIRYDLLTKTIGAEGLTLSSALVAIPTAPAQPGHKQYLNLNALLTPGSYALSVISYDEAGNTSQPSNGVDITIQPDDAIAFTDTIAVPFGDVWIAGEHYQGDALYVTFSGDSLVFNSESAVLWERSETPVGEPFDDAELAAVYGQVPFVKSLTLRGTSLTSAVADYERVCDELIAAAGEAFWRDGPQGALAILEESTLVEHTSLGDSENVIGIYFAGQDSGRWIEFSSQPLATQPKTQLLERRARALIAAIRGVLHKTLDEQGGVVIAISSAGDFMSATGASAGALRSQFDWARGSVLDGPCPPGPLQEGSRFLVEVHMKALETEAAR